MIGQYENIGDIILRRPLMDWLRGVGTLHLYLGPAPEGYVKGLGVQPGDIIYRSFITWYWTALKVAVSGKAHYAFKAGEIQLSLLGLKEHLSALPLVSIIRFRGGKVIRIGSGARNFSALPRALMKPSLWLSQLVIWRDAKTASYMGVGGVMPDLGFAEGDATENQAPQKMRNALIVSMRGDRDQSSEDWIHAVRDYASDRGLEIWVVTQVLRDSAVSRSLAATLGAKLLDWNGEAHDQQEIELRQLYRRAELVVSDRLHVLIAAYTHGAVPIAILAYSSDKIDRHFRAAGVFGICVLTAGRSEEDILGCIKQISANRDAILAALPVARQQLETVRKRVVKKLGPCNPKERRF